MSHDPHSPPPSGNSGYERRDIHVMSIVTGLIVLMTTMFACTIIGYVMHELYMSHVERRPVQLSPLANMRRVAPEPRLQVDPAADLQSLRAAEDSILTSYGWADMDRGMVRIPLSRAQEILASRGLPARSRGER
jgi:hypothetical protein